MASRRSQRRSRTLSRRVSLLLRKVRKNASAQVLVAEVQTLAKRMRSSQASNAYKPRQLTHAKQVSSEIQVTHSEVNRTTSERDRSQPGIQVFFQKLADEKKEQRLMEIRSRKKLTKNRRTPKHCSKTVRLERRPVKPNHQEATELFLFRVHGMNKQADLSVSKSEETLCKQKEPLPLQEDKFGRNVLLTRRPAHASLSEELDEPECEDLPQVTRSTNRKTAFRREVITGSTHPRQVTEWLSQVDQANSTQDLEDTGSPFGSTRMNFKTLDSKLQKTSGR